ncbi:MAG: hypothetical protein QY309_04860 [Cyclobacteriaceae bacterium]|nr:MAG: hypothetical protein QY309_04860 [Cyclobacteriaceae bacterium]
MFVDTSYLTTVKVNDPIKQVATTTTQPAPPQQKANFWDTLFKAADSAANVINAVKQPATQTPTYGGSFQPQPIPQQNNTMKTVLIVGGVAVAGLAAWAIFGKKKKK